MNSPRRGRPRDAALDDTILETTARLLAEGTYFHMSMEEIAEEAGTYKPTIYRRFASKEALAVATIRQLQTSFEHSVVTGDLRTDLLWQLHDMSEKSLRYGGMLMTGLLFAEEDERPEWIERFRQGVVKIRRDAIRGLLNAALERGDIGAGRDFEACVTVLVGAWYATYVQSKKGIPRDWAERVVDVVLGYLKP